MLQIICTKGKKYFELHINNKFLKLYSWNPWCHSCLTNNWNIWNEIKTFCSRHLQSCLMEVEFHLKSDLFHCNCLLHCLQLQSYLKNIKHNVCISKNQTLLTNGYQWIGTIKIIENHIIRNYEQRIHTLQNIIWKTLPSHTLRMWVVTNRKNIQYTPDILV